MTASSNREVGSGETPSTESPPEAIGEADDPKRSALAVALSGGGHRSTLFGFGVLLYLTEASESSRVASIASVSGGSLANGALAEALDYRTAPKEQVEKLIGRASGQIAKKGTVLASGAMRIYLLLVAALACAVGVGTWFLPVDGAVKVLVFAVGVLLLAQVAALRSRVTARAFGDTLLPSGRSSIRLDQIKTDVDHVICATDLHAGENVYFSGRFACSYRFGLGKPGGARLRDAMQASAAFPPVFPPVWLPTKPHEFRKPGDAAAAKTSRLTLTDGGVYDNMADQWARGLDARNRRWAELVPGFGAADELIVVNASAGMSFGSTALLRLPLLGGLLALLRDKSVLYDNGNSVRRQELVARFDLAEREGKGMRGVLVHIAQSPFTVPDQFKERADQWPDRAARAIAAIEMLGDDDETRERWKADSAANTAVATTLVKLGPEVTARLLHHSYVLAAVNAHVILGFPLPELPDRDRFLELVEGG